MTPGIWVIIPAFNEQNAVGKVIREIPQGLVNEVIVVNNASTDATEKAAKNEGAIVLHEDRKGYGYACLKGMEYITSKGINPSDIIVFLDADYSDYPEEMEKLTMPIIEKGYDLVIGSRSLGKRAKGAMTLPQIFGNWLATSLLKLLYQVDFTDLGPFRAIRYGSLISLNMRDKTFGWTVEMQLKAAKHRLKCVEVPVNYRKRIGFSKISGTVKGTLMAGYKIVWTIFKYL